MCVSLQSEYPNKMLVGQQRRAQKGLTCRIPTEGIEQGETLEQAMLRGLWEEFGIHEQRVTFCGIYDTPIEILWGKTVTNLRARDGKQPYIGQQNFAVVATVTGTELKISPHEIIQALWQTEEEAFGSIRYKPPLITAMHAFRKFGLFL